MSDEEVTLTHGIGQKTRGHQPRRRPKMIRVHCHQSDNPLGHSLAATCGCHVSDLCCVLSLKAPEEPFFEMLQYEFQWELPESLFQKYTSKNWETPWFLPSRWSWTGGEDQCPGGPQCGVRRHQGASDEPRPAKTQSSQCPR